MARKPDKPVPGDQRRASLKHGVRCLFTAISAGPRLFCSGVITVPGDQRRASLKLTAAAAAAAKLPTVPGDQRRASLKPCTVGAYELLEWLLFPAISAGPH